MIQNSILQNVGINKHMQLKPLCYVVLWLFRKDEKHYKGLFFCVGASLFVIPKLILFFYQNLEVIPTGRRDTIYFLPIIIESKIKSCTFHEWMTLLQFLVKKKRS